MKQLRQYQTDCLEAIHSFYQNNATGKGLVVLPTGAGKSLVIAEVVSKALSSNKSVLMLTHDARIIGQNSKELEAYIDASKIGVFCAGLKQKDIKPVTYASIQSFAKLKEFLHFDWIIIDECHRVPTKGLGQYGKVLSNYQTSKVLGLTATAYRQGSGLIFDPNSSEKLFDSLIYEVPAIELIQQSFLSPNVYKGSAVITDDDFDAISIKSGEFSELELEEFYRKRLDGIVDKILHQTKDRHKTLIFGVSIDNGKDICELVKTKTQSDCVVLLHSKLSEIEKQTALERLFYDESCKYLVNIDMLTTGFNYTAIDCIAVVRATQSTSLWVQMVGRGSRLHEGKSDCLVLDYGCNVSRHEKAELITTETASKMFANKKNREKYKEWKPYKTCTECETIYSRTEQQCPYCGFRPAKRAKIEYLQASKLSHSGARIVKIDSIEIARHKKAGSPDSLKIVCCYGKSAYNKYGEKAQNFFCFDHSNSWVKEKSRKEFLQLIDSDEEIPNENAVDWALSAFNSDGFLGDITHVQITCERGFDKVVKLFCISGN